MDPHKHNYFQASSLLVSSHGESPLEGNMSLYGKSKANSFAEAIPDPLCKLHLRETSEFVKSFPMSIPDKNGGFLEVSSQGKRRVEVPSTPGRPIFGFTTRKSSFPSKWDDAEKWVMTSHASPARTVKPLSSSESSKIRTPWDDHFKVQDMTTEDFAEKSKVTEERVSKAVPSSHMAVASRDHHGVPSPPDIVLKDKFTDKKDLNIPNFRDVGTEMTPLGSSTTSRCPTPLKGSSPARHNTPASRSGSLTFSNYKHSNSNTRCYTNELIQLEDCHFAKLQVGSQFDSIVSNWSSREEEEEEFSQSLRHHAGQSLKADSDSRAASWEEEEMTKSCLRYQREEAKIQAWVNLQSAKAEAQSKKLEVKIEKMRSKLEEKLMKRMKVVRRKAEEWREAARQQHLEQSQKATEQAQKILKNRHSPCSSRHRSSCGCF